MRNEQEIFDDLAKLCRSQGYAHALAFLCYDACVLGLKNDQLTRNEMVQAYFRDALIHTELSTLVGLLVKDKVDYSFPKTIENFIKETRMLLDELRKAIKFSAVSSNSDVSFMSAAIREVVFYSNQPAYTFQYRDFSIKKYEHDDQWLIENKGFSILEARNVFEAIIKVQNNNITNTVISLMQIPRDQWTVLPGFSFSTKEVAIQSGLSLYLVKKVLQAFSLPHIQNNLQFNKLFDFNSINALPLICIDEEKFILFQTYNLVQALYESPFYWMIKDEKYKDLAMKNRGRFLERFTYERLSLVFGENNVFTKVEFGPKKKLEGEVDVLVVFGERIIIVQNKSKQMTLEARKGNDGCIKNDFQKSIQDAYDQGHKCSKLLFDHKYKDMLKSRNINLPDKVKEIYLLCIISDHYPALTFQAKQFLKFITSDTVRPPLVTDIFFLDVMTEILKTPLYFIDYLQKRTYYDSKLFSAQELTILSYYIKNNLLIDDDVNIQFADDIASDLDVEMAMRREGFAGESFSDSLLARFEGTPFGNMVNAIEKNQDLIDFGFLLLSLNENDINKINIEVEIIAKKASVELMNHSLTKKFDNARGVTFHFNGLPNESSILMLKDDCEIQKYDNKSNCWFGVCIFPDTLSPRFVSVLDYKWNQNDKLDEVCSTMREVEN